MKKKSWGGVGIYVPLYWCECSVFLEVHRELVMVVTTREWN